MKKMLKKLYLASEISFIWGNNTLKKLHSFRNLLL